MQSALRTVHEPQTSLSHTHKHVQTSPLQMTDPPSLGPLSSAGCGCCRLHASILTAAVTAGAHASLSHTHTRQFATSAPPDNEDIQCTQALGQTLVHKPNTPFFLSFISHYGECCRLFNRLFHSPCVCHSLLSIQRPLTHTHGPYTLNCLFLWSRILSL